MIIENLTEDNFWILTAANYKLKYYSTSEDFISDIKRIIYIKKLLTRFKTNGKIDEQLVMNHIIILNNIFGPEFTCRILYLKMASYFEYLKPFLLFLRLLPDKIPQVNGMDIDTITISMNQVIIDKLRAFEKNSKKEVF
jgi:hypothetical protein